MPHGTVGVWCLVVLAPSSTPFQIPSLFRKSFRKTGFSVRKPFPTGDSKISKSLKCAPVQAGTLPRGAKVSETLAQAHPPRQCGPPPGDPQNRLFSTRFLQRLKRLSGVPHWTLRGALGVPMVPPGTQMAPKMTPKWSPKCVPKGLQNAKHRM